MNVKIADALGSYFEILHNINKNFIVLCGMDYYQPMYDKKGTLFEIAKDLFRILPYSIDVKSNKLILSNRNGLLEFSNEIVFLRDDYDIILDNNYNMLDNLRKIRNKCEHKQHAISLEYLDSGTGFIFCFKFNVFNDKGDYEEVFVDYSSLYRIIQSINIMFTKIQWEVYNFANSTGKLNYPYYNKLFRFEFREFNRIFESDIIRIIGRAMLDFQ